MTTYQGGCHCKAVRYEVESDLTQVIACNCSHCGMKGFMLKFVPSDNFKLLQGEDQLSTYQFNKHVINHPFCKNCGVESFAFGTGPDGSNMHAVNIRCLDDNVWEKVDAMKYNGKDA